MSQIQYRRVNRYKYQLVQDYHQFVNTITWRLPILETGHVATTFIEFFNSGDLTIKAGYAWDGPSGPTIDTDTFMRGSLVHDVMYQLMREQHLSPLRRIDADKLLRRMCIQDGMNFIRAAYVYRSLRMFGGASIRPSSKPPALSSPRSVR